MTSSFLDARCSCFEGGVPSKIKKVIIQICEGIEKWLFKKSEIRGGVHLASKKDDVICEQFLMNFHVPNFSSFYFEFMSFFFLYWARCHKSTAGNVETVPSGERISWNESKIQE